MLFTTKNQKGFTLIELSIVLVIVGLLVGGVIVGRDLVKNAKVRKQIKQIEQYQSAYNTFKNKYNCIPGDCLKATTFFSTATNGNGNTRIQLSGGLASLSYISSGATDWATQATELSQFFVQLSLSGLISLNSNGTDVIGKGIPITVVDKDSSFFVADASNFIGGARIPNLDGYQAGNNLIWMVVCNAKGNTDSFNVYSDRCGIVTPIDMKLMDTKLDNGLPLSGKVLGFSGNVSLGYGDGECLKSDYSDYNLTNTEKWCQAAFVLD